MNQLDLIKSVRKQATPPTKVIRPKKGGGYRRKRIKSETLDM